MHPTTTITTTIAICILYIDIRDSWFLCDLQDDILSRMYIVTTRVPFKRPKTQVEFKSGIPVTRDCEKRGAKIARREEREKRRREIKGEKWRSTRRRQLSYS